MGEDSKTVKWMQWICYKRNILSERLVFLWAPKILHDLSFNSFGLFYLAITYLLKVYNRNTRKKVWNMFQVDNKDVRMMSKLNVLRCSGVFTVNFEYISQLFQVFLLWRWTYICLLDICKFFYLQLCSCRKLLKNFPHFFSIFLRFFLTAW